MKWLTRTAAVLLALAAIVALAPRVLPLEGYRVRLEQELSAALAQPVSIGRLEASLLPLPHATAFEVTIGKKEVNARRVEILPDFRSLVSSKPQIRALEFREVVLSPRALGGVFALMQTPAGNPSLGVEHIRIRNATTASSARKFGPFDVDMRLPSKPDERRAVLTSRDGAVTLRARPQREELVIELSAKDWTAPLGQGVRVDALELKALASSRAVEITIDEARVYGGWLRAKARLTWDDTLVLKGRFEAGEIDLMQLRASASHRVHVSGRLHVNGTLDSAASTPTALVQTMRVETKFKVKGGVLHGIDLRDPIAMMTGVSTGGDTQFDEVTGSAVTQAGTHRLTQVQVAAADLRGRGSFVVAPSKALSGRFDASVRGGDTRAAIPLVVGGTLGAPTLQPDPRILSEAFAADGAARKRLREFAREFLAKDRS